MDEILILLLFALGIVMAWPVTEDPSEKFRAELDKIYREELEKIGKSWKI